MHTYILEIDWESNEKSGGDEEEGNETQEARPTMTQTRTCLRV